MALENIMISKAPNGSEIKKENAIVTVDEQGRLSEPIRKQATKSPMMFLSPKQVVSKFHKIQFPNSFFRLFMRFM